MSPTWLFLIWHFTCVFMATLSERYIAVNELLLRVRVVKRQIWKVNWQARVPLGFHLQQSFIYLRPKPWLQPFLLLSSWQTHQTFNKNLAKSRRSTVMSSTHIEKWKIIELAFSLSRNFICCGWKGKNSIRPDFRWNILWVYRRRFVEEIENR